jgi:hypothetical protein
MTTTSPASSTTTATTTASTATAADRARRPLGRYLAGVATAVVGLAAAGMATAPTAGADTVDCSFYRDVTAGPVWAGRATGQCPPDTGHYYIGINGAISHWSLGTLYLPGGQMITGGVDNIWGLPGQSITLPGF